MMEGAFERSPLVLYFSFLSSFVFFFFVFVFWIWAALPRSVFQLLCFLTKAVFRVIKNEFGCV
ncbi:hypothetical protein IQ07DRAFT_236225 [Pyrenochaeta sp. DS3sAY3a]|nr:hypothetical protein IQ07DRAFT_236225 [Pyrenochaeta sp. DS3sAY3a]